ncbi:hypothetical protein JG687_00014769 [Phytophthora cactorum]|uniref:Uncharacterized protein n=1 Tax=Phytophthora cactorum TaxID=29920 RepID=A0A8T1TYI7_9STRA|nr:hypothetical protein GQ600_11925 [Phytophthora cactorum]KAG6949586.1 hypothetical protein JG687_00014769 [Phytophthora cactorum]
MHFRRFIQELEQQPTTNSVNMTQLWSIQRASSTCTPEAYHRHFRSLQYFTTVPRTTL